MKKLMTILCGCYLGFAMSGALVAAEEAVEAAADTDAGGALVDFLQTASSLLPFPWNVVGASALSAAAAVFAWKKASTKKTSAQKKDE